MSEAAVQLYCKCKETQAQHIAPKMVKILILIIDSDQERRGKCVRKTLHLDSQLFHAFPSRIISNPFYHMGSPQICIFDLTEQICPLVLSDIAQSIDSRKP